jgi:hypothetical protein
LQAKCLAAPKRNRGQADVAVRLYRYRLHAVVLIAMTRARVEGVALLLCTFGLTIGLSSLSFRFIETPPIRWAHDRRPKSEFVRPVLSSTVS